MKWGSVSAVSLLSVSGLLAQAPAVADGGVVNAASFAAGQAVAPGSLVSIFGSNLAAALAQASSIPLSTSLGDVASVTFNGVASPLIFVSGGQINAQLPWEVPPGSATVVVTRGNASSAPKSFSVATIAPGIFSVEFGVGQAIAINLDGSLAAPEGSLPGVPTHPAGIGSTILLLATGLGPVSPPALTGNNSLDALRNATVPPVVLIGGVPAQQIDFAGLSPQFVGVNQLNVVVPPGAPTGNAVPVQIQSGGIISTDRVTMAIR